MTFSLTGNCDGGFASQNLEKSPLAEVAPEPAELLDKTRYDFSRRELPEAEEALLPVRCRL